jgi:hypothetical protein
MNLQPTDLNDLIAVIAARLDQADDATRTLVLSDIRAVIDRHALWPDLSASPAAMQGHRDDNAEDEDFDNMPV